MRKNTLYIDESGKYSLRTGETDPFIVTGVIIQKRDIGTIEGFFRYIKRKYKIKTDQPFHSYDIYEHPSRKLSDSVLKKLSFDLADFISIIPIEIKIIQVDKNRFKKALGIKSDSELRKNEKTRSMREFPYRITFCFLLDWFSTYLKNDDYLGDIVTDSRRSADKNLIDALEFSKSPECSLSIKSKTTIKNRCAAICFANKSFLSGALELTDFISYTSFFKARNMIDAVKPLGLRNAWNKIRPKLNGGRIYTLTIEEVKKFFNVEDGTHEYLK